MKLESVLDNLNSFEKNSFLKVINDIIGMNPKNIKQIDKILNENSRDLKNVDNLNIAKVFNLLEEEYRVYVSREFVNTTSQLDILIDIIIRDGNCIMKQDWFSRLYDVELKEIKKKVKDLDSEIKKDKSNIDETRLRDYKTYQSCVHTAYTNDDENNSDRKVTSDEQTILHTLSNCLGLSQEEVKLINYMTIPVEKFPIDIVINNLKNIGVIFYSKKNNTVYVADEMVRVLRKVRNKEVADKFFRRVLRQLREPMINLICKKHNIDRKQSLNLKIKEIIKEGLIFRDVLSSDIFKDDVKISDRKKIVTDICTNQLNIPSLKGSTLPEKIESLINYFEEVEREEKVGISIDGYGKLLTELNECLPQINKTVKQEFELQSESVMNNILLLDYNIKPLDILELLSKDDLKKFSETHDIKQRGDVFSNILETYKDTENLLLENYELIAVRDLKALNDSGIKIKESEIGLKFEEMTKNILTQLGFNVDEELRKIINTAKDKIDILIRLENNDLILVECKTNKSKEYNKFSAVSRQLKSYAALARKKDFRIIKSLLIAPDFSDDFISECEVEYELNLSLISASSLYHILKGLQKSKLKKLPYKLLMRDVIIQEDRIIKAIS